MESNKQKQSLKANKNALKTAIIISWIVLAVCFIIKLFGGKCFNIATNNNTFNKVCTFIDSYLWLQNFISFFTSILSIGLLNLAVLRKRFFTSKQIIMIFICAIIPFSIKVVSEYCNIKIFAIIGFIADIIPYCICPMILSKKPIRSIASCVLYILFQALSVVIKGLSITKINSDNTLIALTFTIDVYIMLILYYLYANNKKVKSKIQEKGGNNNG